LFKGTKGANQSAVFLLLIVHYIPEPIVHYMTECPRFSRRRHPKKIKKKKKYASKKLYTISRIPLYSINRNLLYTISRNIRAGQISRGGIRHAFRGCIKKTGISKKVCVHTLRHSYATHLLEMGLDIVSVKNQMGPAKNGVLLSPVLP
jgi:integrase